MSSIATLLGISEAIAIEAAALPTSSKALWPIYSNKNGLLSFESSLMLLPTVSSQQVPSLQEWNAPSGWRRHYDLPDDVVFFAMDVFACQFGLNHIGIVRFEPESGDLSSHSVNLEEWATKLLNDYDYELGFPVAHDWQMRYGPLPLGARLLPKQPFTLGGEYSADNVIRWPVRDATQQFANLHRQIANVPDGQPVTITGWLVPKAD